MRQVSPLASNPQSSAEGMKTLTEKVNEICRASAITPPDKLPSGGNANEVLTGTGWKAIVDNLTAGGSTDVLSAEQGKVLKALIDGITIPDIVDNLTTGGSTKTLSAEQGKALKILIDALSVPKVGAIIADIDAGIIGITTGIKTWTRVPVACTITGVTALSDQTGSVVIDIWKDTYANFPPTDADSITAAAPVTISASRKSENTTLTGWNKSINAGDILMFNVDSVSSLEHVVLEIRVTVP